VVLTSGESPNLKTLLKHLIAKATSLVGDDDNDIFGNSMTTSNPGPKLLDFDFGHLFNWRSQHRADRIVVAIQDSEAFDANLLDEMIDLFSYG
jgi:origin recognition complex subunit 3